MAFFDGAERRMNREHDERMELAWTVERLARLQKLPPFKSLLSRKRRKPARRDPKQEFDAWAAWAAAYSPS